VLPFRFQQGLDELPRLRPVPIACPDHQSDEVALPIDEVRGGRPPHTPLLPGHIPALIEQDGGNVSSLLDGPFDQVRVLADIHEEDFEALVFELAVEPVDGR
jgi:hypothetical protein